MPSLQANKNRRSGTLKSNKVEKQQEMLELRLDEQYR